MFPIELFVEYCLSKKGVTEHFPFDETTLVFKVADKMFALTSLKKWEEGNPFVNVKCDPERSQELRATYDAIRPGFHMNKKHWNSIYLHESDINITLFKELIDHSYTLVIQSLPKKRQKEFYSK